MAETTFWKPAGFQVPKLTVFSRQDEPKEYILSGVKQMGRLTPQNDPDIGLRSSTASRTQGRFIVQNDRCVYQDAGSRNGTWINDQLWKQTDGARELEDGDVFAFRPAFEKNRDEILLFTTGDSETRKWVSLPLGDDIAEITVGRNSGDFKLLDTAVSEKHAAFFHASEGWSILDCGSTNGVYRNQKRIHGAVYLQPMDVIRIADAWFVFTGAEIWVGMKPSADGNALSASGKDSQLSIAIEERNVWQRLKKKTLLKDINLTIADGEMVLILGGSGAGKTTFMNAVMGYEKAKGTIAYGDRNIYEEYERMKYEIGFVPQQDLLRAMDTVEDTLRNAAKMRMPASASIEERKERVEEVLVLMGLAPERKSLVSKLSGGQRKRLSIAVEFMSNPRLFFLDEPDSGLDGVMARTLMENLRQIADQGKIVMVITHGPDRAAELFDKVVVLAKSPKDQSGHLAFFGSVDDAYTFFDTNSLEGVVRRINREDEGGDGQADHYIEKFKARSRK